MDLDRCVFDVGGSHARTVTHSGPRLRECGYTGTVYERVISER